MAKKTPIDKLSNDISKILAEYGDEVKENVAEISVEIAKKGAQALKSNSKQMFPNGTGLYASGWSVETSGKVHRQVSWSNIIYNKYPGMPHLLENGHAKRGGGRVAGRAHIAPVEQELIEQYTREITEKL